MNATRRRIPDRFFRMLLRVFPFDFRADHGGEMEQVFRAQRADAGGPGSLVRLWLETVQDVLATAPLQHVVKSVFSVPSVACYPRTDITARYPNSISAAPSTALTATPERRVAGIFRELFSQSSVMMTNGKNIDPTIV
jgi:hypothetical protein